MKNGFHPDLLHRPRPVAGFAANNHPVNAGQIQIVERPKRRLQRKELDLRAGRSQVIDALSVISRLQRHPSRRSAANRFAPKPEQSPGAFCQDLKSMPVRLAHNFENSLNEIQRHINVEKIRHRIDENVRGLFPRERDIEGVWV